MTNEDAEAHLELQRRAGEIIDARLDKLVDRSWRAADQTLNGMCRQFIREVTLLQRLPFPQSQ